MPPGTAARRRPPTVPGVARLTVASFNAHYGRDRRGRPFGVVEVCRRLDADLLVVQESWIPDDGEGEADRAARQLGYHAKHVPMGTARVAGRKPRLVPRQHGQGLLAVSMLSRYPVVSESVLEMPHLHLDAASRRPAIRTEVSVEGGTFVFVGTHLDHLTHGSPLALRRLARQLPGPDQAAALAGDMNMWGPVLSALLPGWTLAGRGPTWPNPRPHSHIDHIAVNARVRAESFEVVRAGASDHFPVRAVLRF